MGNSYDGKPTKDIWSGTTGIGSVGAMPQQAVLVVEREADSRLYLERQLTVDGFEVFSADRAGQALALVESVRPDVVVLEDDLPDSSGLEMCRLLREGELGRFWNRDIPIIMVSERSDPVDRVRGFARGCDDYLTRPFAYEELLARIRAILRRVGAPRGDVRRVGELEIDGRTRLVRVAGSVVYLSVKEYELLVALAREPQRAYGKDELLCEVWGFRSAARTRTLDSHASRLRRKLSVTGEGRFVLNVWGVGYRLVAPDGSAPTDGGPSAIQSRVRNSQNASPAWSL